MQPTRVAGKARRRRSWEKTCYEIEKWAWSLEFRPDNQLVRHFFLISHTIKTYSSSITDAQLFVLKFELSEYFCYWILLRPAWVYDASVPSTKSRRKPADYFLYCRYQGGWWRFDWWYSLQKKLCASYHARDGAGCNLLTFSSLRGVFVVQAFGNFFFAFFFTLGAARVVINYGRSSPTLFLSFSPCSPTRKPESWLGNVLGHTETTWTDIVSTLHHLL